MFWIAYFMLSIAAIGLPIAYGICLPLYLLSWIHPGARDGADSILCWGIGRLMRVQPWWNGNIDLTAPMGGALLVSNHRSHLDAFLFLSRIKGVRMLARQSLFNNPFLGIMMMASGQISTRRGRVDSFWRAMNMVERKLNSGLNCARFSRNDEMSGRLFGNRPLCDGTLLGSQEGTSSSNADCDRRNGCGLAPWLFRPSSKAAGSCANASRFGSERLFVRGRTLQRNQTPDGRRFGWHLICSN